MIAAPPLGEIQQSAHVPRLLVELPSRRRVFFENLRDLMVPRRLPPLELHSAPAPFWPDVFVKRPLPWSRFVQSGVYHVVAFALLIGLTRFFAMQPQVIAKPTFDHAQVIYYQPSEYLPPIDTREAQAAQPRAADPEISRQPIISLPREADNQLADHRHTAQRQAEARCSPAQYCGLVRHAGKAAAGHPGCAVDSGGRENAACAPDGNVGSEATARCGPSHTATQLSGSAEFRGRSPA